jgi:hypothetical protein
MRTLRLGATETESSKRKIWFCCCFCARLGKGDPKEVEGHIDTPKPVTHLSGRGKGGPDIAMGSCTSTPKHQRIVGALLLWAAAAAAAAAATLAEKKVAAEAADARRAQQKAAAALKAQQEAAAALKAQQEAAAALEAQQEAAAAKLAEELALWRLEVEIKVVGKVEAVYQIVRVPANQQLELLRRAAVHHVVNPVLQAAYERKKDELAARLGGAANVNEKFLFHGTSLANSKAIIRNNFCLSKVRTQSRCRCCVLVVIESLLFFILLTHRTRVRSDETLAARWEPAQGTQVISEEASISLTICITHTATAGRIPLLCSCARCSWVRTSSSHRLHPPHLPTASRPSLIHNDRM